MTDTLEQKKETPKVISRKEYIAKWEKARLKAKIDRLKNRIYKLNDLNKNSYDLYEPSVTVYTNTL